ncbi:MAG: hypothetical protein COV75_03975 [Candidatus Omnitrophica bacterium CG11_big_fil_rev_8_21_14_0_20_63_9]|nr:MAG: hypothetical protein COV75_03975 [Candidatus Omnitrophica bacterium CG11_big_fil_rev_8_21_14_0_20_63_9]
MKIAVVAPEVFPVPPVRGGAVETVIEEVSAHFVGHDVHVFSIADPMLPPQETKAHRTYHRWQQTWLDRLMLCSWKLPFKQSGSRLYYRPYAQWVACHVKRLNPDVIWVHSRVQFVPALRQAAPKARLILSLHNESNFAGDAVWSERAIAAVDVFTGCSGYLTEALKQARPTCSANAKVLYNGVDPDTFAPRWAKHDERQRLRQSHGLDGPVVLYVGRLVEAKGVHVLIEAFAATQAAIPDATLVIVGSHTFSDPTKTAYIERLRALAAPLGERIRFVGHIGREAIHQYFLMADVLAFPSIWQEPFGMVILEAQAAGLPVVAFDHGGPSEIIRHGRNGLLVDRTQEAAGFAEALTRCLGDSTMREVIGREARWTVEERFTWRGVAEELLRIAGGAARARVLIAESSTGYGGSAKYLHELLTVLDRRRFDVHVSSAQDGPFIRKIREQGVPVTLVPAWRFPRNERWGRAFLLLGGGAQLFSTVPAIARWLNNHQVQLVHLNNEILTHVPLLLAAKLTGCRVVCHLHGWRPSTLLERFVAPLVDEFVCISHAGARYYAQQLKRQVVAIPNGIALNGHASGLDAKRAQMRAQLHLTDNDRVVTILGRLVSWKGQDIVLKALAQLAPRYPNLRGLVVGQDPHEDQRDLKRLHHLAQELGLGSRVHFTGWQADVWAMYAAADIVVHASTKPEPFGLVLLEAMAAGRPVIATRAGGVTDIVSDGRTGLLVDPGDADALARAISRLLDDEVLSAALVQRARVRVSDEFVIIRNAAQITALYDHLVARR